MNISVEIKGSVAIIKVTGKLVVSHELMKLGGEVKNQIANGHNDIILELGGVESIDSTGFGALINCKDGVVESGGLLKLVNISKAVNEIIERSNATELFATYDNIKQASLAFAF